MLFAESNLVIFAVQGAVVLACMAFGIWVVNLFIRDR